MVTLISSSRNTSWSGEGRKSRTTLSSPSGSSVYLILALIDLLAPPPVTGADDSNGIRAVREANRHDAFTDRASAKANCACTNETPCFDWFRRSFSGSHSKHTPAIPAMGSGKRPEGHTNVWLRSDLR